MMCTDSTSYFWMLALIWSNKTEICCHNKILIFAYCLCVLTVILKHFVLLLELKHNGISSIKIRDHKAYRCVVFSTPFSLFPDRPYYLHSCAYLLTLNIPILARQRCLSSWGPRRTPCFLFFGISQLFDAVDYSNYVFWVSETIIQWFKHC